MHGPVLPHLRTEDTTELTVLAESLLLDRTALSRTLEPLEERGLITVVSGRDARTRDVSLTRAGEKAIRTAEPYWKHAQAQVAARVGAGKLDALVATLRELEQLHPDPGGLDR